MDAFVGTSGYQYEFWRGTLYPEGLDKKDMLAHYAQQFPTVEVNNTFYRMPKTEVVQRWADATPDEFRFVIKASRRITHSARLTDAQSVEYLFRVLEPLGDKLGAVLFQCPPFLRKDLDLLRGFLDMLPADAPAVLEFRHVSWFDEEVYAVLRSGPAAMSVGDYEGKGSSDQLRDGCMPMVATAPWGYARLRAEDYTPPQLETWAAALRAHWSRVFVFFKHEQTAPGNARQLLGLLSAPG